MFSKMHTECNFCLRSFPWKLSRCPHCHHRNRKRPAVVIGKILAILLVCACAVYAIYCAFLTQSPVPARPTTNTGTEPVRDVQFSR